VIREVSVVAPSSVCYMWTIIIRQLSISCRFSFDSICADHVGSVFIVPRAHHRQGMKWHFSECTGMIHCYGFNKEASHSNPPKMPSMYNNIQSLHRLETIAEHTLHTATNNSPRGDPNDLRLLMLMIIQNRW